MKWSEKIGVFWSIVLGVVAFLYFPIWMYLKLLYDYELSFLPVFALGLGWVYYHIFILNLFNLQTSEAKQ